MRSYKQAKDTVVETENSQVSSLTQEPTKRYSIHKESKKKKKKKLKKKEEHRGFLPFLSSRKKNRGDAEDTAATSNNDKARGRQKRGGRQKLPSVRKSRKGGDPAIDEEDSDEMEDGYEYEEMPSSEESEEDEEEPQFKGSKQSQQQESSIHSFTHLVKSAKKSKFRRNKSFAASVIQRSVRKYLAYLKEKAERERQARIEKERRYREIMREQMKREYWWEADINLHQVHRHELEDLLRRLDLPVSGSREDIMDRFNRWALHRSLIADVTAMCATFARERTMSGEGGVYTLQTPTEACRHPTPVHIHPLRGYGLERVFASFSSDRVYGIDHKHQLYLLAGSEPGVVTDRSTQSVTTCLEDGSVWKLVPQAMVTLSREMPHSIGIAKHATLACTQSGELFSWGLSPHGEIGDSKEANHGKVQAPTVVRTSDSLMLRRRKDREAQKFTHVSCGLSHCIAVDSEDTIYAWGSNATHQLGLPNASKDSTFTSPMKVEWQHAIHQISCGVNFTAAIDGTGNLLTWGCSDSGRLGRRGTSAHTPSPVAMEGQRCLSVSCGAWHTLAIFTENSSDDGGGWAHSFGTGLSGQLGSADTTIALTPIRVTSLDQRVITVRAGTFVSAAITTDRLVYCWGSRGNGMFEPTPRLAQLSRTSRKGTVLDIACTASSTIIVTARLSESEFTAVVEEQIREHRRMLRERDDLERKRVLALTSEITSKSARKLQGVVRAVRVRKAMVSMVEGIYESHPLGGLKLDPSTGRVDLLATLHMPRVYINRHTRREFRKLPAFAFGAFIPTLEEKMAANRLQNRWRVRRAWNELRRRVAKVYELCFDDDYPDYPFYYNKLTKKSSWTAPFGLSLEQGPPSVED